MKDYLSEEEQYKEILNQEEIGRIRDLELQAIRSKYWGLRHKAFLDEHVISDSELESVFDRLKEAEMREIEEYKAKKRSERRT